MNNKIIAIVAVLSATLIAGVFATSPLAYAYDGGDESETNTEQALKQKNVGSGESTNFNCGENSIKGGVIDAQLCGTADIGDGDGGGDGRQVTICHRPPGNPENEQTLRVGLPAVPAHLAHGDSLGAC